MAAWPFRFPASGYNGRNAFPMTHARLFFATLAASSFAALAVTAGTLALFGPDGNAVPGVPVEKTVRTVRLTELQGEVESAAAAVSPAVVSIVATKDIQTWRSDPFGFFFEPGAKIRRDVGGGTGIFVTKSGAILTNKHVVSDPAAEYRAVLADGREFPARVKALDPATDLAVVQADLSGAAVPAAEFASRSEPLRVGNFVVAIGNALAEFRNSVTLGIVSGLGRSINARGRDGESSLRGLVQTDAAINPGNSGGPLVNLSGKVAGVNTAVASGGSGIGFAIPVSAEELAYLLRSVESTGKIRRAYLGVRYSTVDAGLAARLRLPAASGDYVLDDSGAVAPGSPAEKAGLRSGDLVRAVDGVPLTPDYTLKEALSDRAPGAKVTLRVLRGSAETLLSAELGER